MLRIALSTLMITALPLSSGWTQTVPIPGNKDVIMNQPLADMKAHQERQRELRDNLANIDDEIDGLRDSMIKVAREVRSREREMSGIEDRIDDLQAKRTAIQKKLQYEHKDIVSLATAMVRLRAVPPEALIARPGAPLETAQAAMILRDVVTPVQTRALALSQDLDELAKLESDLNERRTTLKTASQKILADQTKLADLVRRREAAYANVKSDLDVQEHDLANLAQDAADFKDLITKLEDRNRAIADASENESRPHFLQASVPPRLDRKALKSLGDAQMPLAGIVRVKYGALDDMGSESQGVKIEGRAGAIVVAPMNGVVRYKGRFKNYGNMIIIEHGKNYHSLVAGLAKIDTVVGQSVMAGEPLGVLGTTRSARPSVYYELRQNGKPVNPARLLADLG